MKVAISSTGKNLQSEIYSHFGRCPFFIIVDTDDMSFETFDNKNMTLSGGAGIQAAGFLASKGVSAVLTGNCGPNAMKTFSAAGIPVFTDLTGDIVQAVENYKQGSLTPSIEATVSEKAGSGQMNVTDNRKIKSGEGRCMGGAGRGMGGGGRGLGGGRCMEGDRRGVGMKQGITRLGVGGNPLPTKEENLIRLKEQATELQRQMDMIQEKIRSMQQQ
jgi:predicted Fe-Mo cluster-binding NifX family protein